MSGRVPVAVVLATAALACPARADDLGQVLTGGSSRVWTAEPIVRDPEPGRSCRSGEVWTFATTGEVTVDRCEAGRLAASRHAWSVLRPADGSATLAVDGVGSFAATLGAGAHRLRLRGGERTSGPEKELRREDD